MSQETIARCKWFSAQKGWGFLEQENGEDLFVHFSEILSGDGEFKTLEKGDRVSVEEIFESDKGLNAKGVRKIEKEGEVE